MILKNDADLLINEDASLTLYLGGNFEGKNSSDINNENKLPKNLKIYGLDGCESMVFKNSSDFYGTIYAPNAHVEMKNSADVYGSVIAESFDQKNSADFFYDASLRDASVYDEAVRFVVTDWHEE
jgi:choice-of-anchor A domain-containing protein